MVNNEWDDILYWDNYEPFHKLMQELDRRYDINDPIRYDKWCEERDTFYRQTIPTKEEFVRRFQYYIFHGKPYWIEGHHIMMNEVTEADLMKSYHFASETNGVCRVKMAENACHGWVKKSIFYLLLAKTNIFYFRLLLSQACGIIKPQAAPNNHQFFLNNNSSNSFSSAVNQSVLR